ncbi:MAG TPA: cysteine desulfurase family protein [Bacteroidia bacterium]|nr:cysteine desulfurase family protein [Bacteroidia bacterium]HNT80850.1 cysteine desulfurase family protein [Bacteroidia bacterium]
MENQKVYLDNAATTAIHPEVIDAMVDVMRNDFGNPSSIHSFGRKSRSIIENCRKKIAELMHCSPGEIFFTSGGTEANNTAIRCSVRDLGIKTVISSCIEHHAVLHTCEDVEHIDHVKFISLKVDAKGKIDINELESHLAANKNVLVSLMHANNEIGTLNPIHKISELCQKYQAVFHSDTVQTVGHYPINLSELKIDFISCAAHKFHGPKGVGFLYKNANAKIKPLITGGAQERNFRGGTENLYGIVGLTKALQLAYENLSHEKKYIEELKHYMLQKLQDELHDIRINGCVGDEALYTVLNVSFPETELNEMILFNLDINGIAASGGSACSSGSEIGSHVLKSIGANPSRPSVRFSFSRFTNKGEIDYTISKLKEIFLIKA